MMGRLKEQIKHDYKLDPIVFIVGWGLMSFVFLITLLALLWLTHGYILIPITIVAAGLYITIRWINSE